MSDKRRLFVAVKPPSGTLERIEKHVHRIIGEQKDKCIRWVKRENMHITLKFIGDIKNENFEGIISAVEKSLNGLKKFEVKTGKVIFFPNQLKPRILAVEISGRILVSYAEKIDNTLIPWGIEKESRKFRGHITIGRVKKKLKKSLKTDQIALEEKINVEEIHIVESILKPHGAEYFTLKRIVLN